MDNLSNTAENLALDWVLGVGTPARPTTPLKVALVTAAGSDTAAGTEVTGGSYARQNLAVAAAVGGATSNSRPRVHRHAGGHGRRCGDLGFGGHTGAALVRGAVRVAHRLRRG